MALPFSGLRGLREALEKIATVTPPCSASAGLFRGRARIAGSPVGQLQAHGPRL